MLNQSFGYDLIILDAALRVQILPILFVLETKKVIVAGSLSFYCIPCSVLGVHQIC